MAFMAAAAPFLQVAMGAMSIIGGIRQQGAAMDAAEHNRRVEMENARLLQERKKEEAEELRYQQRKNIARQRVNVAKSGVQMSGSPIEVLGEIDYRNLRDYKNFVKTSNYDVYRARNQAHMNFWSASNKASAQLWEGIGTGASTALGGAYKIWGGGQ